MEVWSQSSPEREASLDYLPYIEWRYAHGKKIRDNVHKYSTLGPTAVKILDTSAMQRLRRLKQLGVTYFVYPSAEHTRFAHSLGVGHLGWEFMRKTADKDRDLDIRPLDMLKVEVAGLVHDVGHGPFSHMFEKELLPQLGVHDWEHEEMSCRVFEDIVDRLHLDLGDNNFTREVQDIISSGKKKQRQCNWTGRSFMLEIVANDVNGVDVDKIDYLHRDSLMTGMGCTCDFSLLLDNARVFDVTTPSQGDPQYDKCLAYKDTVQSTLQQLFVTRGTLHNEVYTHRKCKCVEYMILDALVLGNKFLRLQDKIHDVHDFLKLDDSLPQQLLSPYLSDEWATDPDIIRAQKLLQRVESRDWYRYCTQMESPDLGGVRVTAQDVVGCQVHNNNTPLVADDIIVQTLQINMGRGAANPMDTVLLYSSKDQDPYYAARTPFQPASFEHQKVRVFLRKQVELGQQARYIAAVNDAFQRCMKNKGVRELRTPRKRGRSPEPATPESVTQISNTSHYASLPRSLFRNGSGAL